MQKSNVIKYSALFILLVLIQVAVLNKISLLGYATPFIYIYFILKLPIGFNRNLVLLLGFLLGFVIDIFCNTPGINASATALAAFLRRPIQKLFFLADDYTEQIPSLSLLRGGFIKYSFLIVLIHQIALISIESFSFLNFEIIVLRIILSTILTLLIIYTFEGFSLKKKDRE